MMKALIFSVITISLSACSMSPVDSIKYQRDNRFDEIKFQTNSSENLSVHDLRGEYKEKTGQSLPNQSTYECQKDALCYYNKYASAYGLMLDEFNERKRKEEADLAQKKTDDCMANEECAAKKRAESASFLLNNLYSSIMAQNQYLQADYDAYFRRLCRAAGTAQRRGVTQEQMQKNIDLAEGVSPNDRYQFKQVASACWTLSKGGIPDGTTQIRSMY